MTSRFSIVSFVRAVAIGAFLGMVVAPALADDVLHLKDGRVLHGEIVRELDGGYLFFRYEIAGIEQETLFGTADYERIERDAAAPTEEAATAKAGDDPVDTPEYEPGVPRIAVLTLGAPDRDMVGIYITAEALERAIPLLEEQGVTDVVFYVRSGGGYTLEMERLSKFIYEEYKPRFRTVAWIESAISAAAMTVHCLDEIYFMPEGNYGACTEWSGQLNASKGRRLEEVLYFMEKVSARGHHDYRVMRSMQIMEPLSCTINDATGEVTWYQDTSGEIVVNEEGRILTLDAPTAEKVKFSQGTAATLDELAKAMGYQEVQWVGEWRDGYMWPICEAEELQMDFREKTAEDERRANEYFTVYTQSVQIAQGMQERDQRARFVNRARQALSQIDQMVQNNPNFSLFIMNMVPEQYEEWLRQQHQLLRDLMK